MNNPKGNRWCSKIESKEDAVGLIKGYSNGFLFLAAVQIVAGFLSGIYVSFDGVVLIILALLLRKFKSRIVSIMLLLLSIFTIVATGINLFGEGKGGIGIILAGFMLWASIGAIHVTFQYNKIK